ncbi:MULTISPECIES: PDDEXK nuclease domain-containing protein [unclassified Ensifer]|uniref:PDDEXK nuclease domain-containing protein n=1 Tax=unclassified Ensifer TaxID=2633371 RepID=UPI0023780AA9|nr:MULTISPECIES: PDDEXK nuclease domain-containing protein [unclassified Ensifer]
MACTSFDFLTLGPAMSGRELEQSLLEHLRSLILELGKGLAFVGSQHHLEDGSQAYNTTTRWFPSIHYAILDAQSRKYHLTRIILHENCVYFYHSWQPLFPTAIMRVNIITAAENHPYDMNVITFIRSGVPSISAIYAHLPKHLNT